jgi:hypothetical protein
LLRAVESELQVNAAVAVETTDPIFHGSEPNKVGPPEQTSTSRGGARSQRSALSTWYGIGCEVR